MKEDIGVANKNIKRCSSSVLIKEIQIKNYNEILLIGVEYNTFWLEYKMVLLFWKIIWHFFSFFKNYLFLAVLGFHCCSGFCLIVAGWCYSNCYVRASHCSDFSCGAQPLGHVGFSSCGSEALEHRLNSCVYWLSCSEASGIFPDQESNPCLPHWQVDSLLISHRGSPI